MVSARVGIFICTFTPKQSLFLNFAKPFLYKNFAKRSLASRQQAVGKLVNLSSQSRSPAFLALITAAQNCYTRFFNFSSSIIRPFLHNARTSSKYRWPCRSFDHCCFLIFLAERFHNDFNKVPNGLIQPLIIEDTHIQCLMPVM